MKLLRSQALLSLLVMCNGINSSLHASDSEARYRNILEKRGAWEQKFREYNVSAKCFIRRHKKKICGMSAAAQMGLSIPLWLGSFGQKKRWLMPISIASLLNSCATLFAIRSLSEVEHAEKDEDILLPEELYDLKNYEVIQVPSAIQDGPCCGWYMVMNAAAIQTLLYKLKELSQYAIEYEVYKLTNHFKRYLGKDYFKSLGINDFLASLTTLEEQKLAQSLKLQSFYAMSMDGFGSLHYLSQAEVLPHVGPGNLAKNEQQYYYYWLSMASLKKLLRFKKVGKYNLFHILLSVPSSLSDNGHAVLLTIIKRKDEKPLILYMDSNNHKLSHYEHEYPISYFVIKFIRMLDKEGPIV